MVICCRPPVRILAAWNFATGVQELTKSRKNWAKGTEPHPTLPPIVTIYPIESSGERQSAPPTLQVASGSMLLTGRCTAMLPRRGSNRFGGKGEDGGGTLSIVIDAAKTRALLEFQIDAGTPIHTSEVILAGIYPPQPRKTAGKHPILLHSGS